MKAKIILLFLFIQSGLFAQLTPEFVPDDLPGETGGICDFCKPGLENKSRSKGVVVSYGWNPNATFTEEGTKLQSPYTSFDKLRHWIIDAKIPVMNKPGFKILIAYKYTAEKYEFDKIGADYSDFFTALDNEILRGTDLGFLISKSFDETKYLVGYFKYANKGNYDTWMNFDSDGAIYKARMMFGKKPNPSYEWGIGINFTSSFRRTIAIPALLLNKNWNDRWGFESILPAFAFIRYNFNDENLFMGGFQIAGQTFRVKLPTDAGGEEMFDYSLNHSEVRALVKWQRKIIPWVWTELQLGYQLNFSTEFEGFNDFSPTFDADPTSAPYFNIALFLSPPKKFIK